MEKNLEITILFDIYGTLLTKRQRGVMEQYYEFDNSLAEIAEMLQISRQSVRDSIVSATEALNRFESQLHLKDKFEKITNLANVEIEKAEIISNEETLARMNDILKILEE
ncbi:MAG: sigma factor-like helix-turn-helix DNA-binding protein [Clostridia bacterium]